MTNGADPAKVVDWATKMAEQQQHGICWITASNFYQLL